MTAGSWEHIATWWDDHAGEWGDYYHQHLIMPALLGALGDVTGLSVIDLGCGNGTSSRWLRRAGGTVVGVDVSTAMVERARAWEQRHPLEIEYIVSDAANVPSLPDASADRVVANMLLHDMADAAACFREACRLLKPDGRFLASFLHPCFVTAHGSSWRAETLDVQTRDSGSAWRYAEPFVARGVVRPGQPEPHTLYHRPLGWYCERLVEAGLLIDCLAEPIPDETFKAERRDRYELHATLPFVVILGGRRI